MISVCGKKMEEIKIEETKITDLRVNIEVPRKKLKIIWFVLGLAGVAAILSYYYFLAPYLAGYFYDTGKFYMELGAYGDAKKNFNTSLFFNPKRPQSYGYLGGIELGLWDNDPENHYPNGNYEEAIKYFNKAVELGIADDKENYKFLLQMLGDAHRALKQYEKSDEYYLKKIESYPEYSFWPSFFVARDYVERFNKPQEARELMNKIIKVSSRYNFQKLLTDKEINYFQPVILAKDVDYYYLYKAYSLLADIYFYFNDYIRAVNFANLAIVASKGRNVSEIERAYIILARIEGFRGNFDSAENYIKKAEEIFGLPGKYTCILAHVHLNLKNYKEAVRVAEGVVKKNDPYNYAHCLFSLGRSFEELRDKKKGVKFFEEYLAMTDSFEPKDIFVNSLRNFVIEHLKSPGDK